MHLGVPLWLYGLGFVVSLLDRTRWLREEGWLVLPGLLLGLAGAVAFVAGAAPAGPGAFFIALAEVLTALVIGAGVWLLASRVFPKSDPQSDAFAFLLDRGFTEVSFQFDPGIFVPLFQSALVRIEVRDSLDGCDVSIGRRSSEDGSGLLPEDARRLFLTRGVAPVYRLDEILRLDPGTAGALDMGLRRCAAEPRYRRRRAYAELYAGLLRVHGESLLMGDFSAAKPLDAIWLARARGEHVERPESPVAR